MTELTKDSKTNIKLLADLINQYYENGNVLIGQLTFCQAILEAGLLRSPPSLLALKYNNLFGVKGLGTGKLVDGVFKNNVIMPTHEVYHGDVIEVDARFAVNTSIEDSIKQHDKVLKLPRYANLWTAKYFKDVAKLVQADGYATDPHYPEKLIDLYNKYIRV